MTLKRRTNVKRKHENKLGLKINIATAPKQYYNWRAKTFTIDDRNSRNSNFTAKRNNFRRCKFPEYLFLLSPIKTYSLTSAFPVSNKTVTRTDIHREASSKDSRYGNAGNRNKGCAMQIKQSEREMKKCTQFARAVRAASIRGGKHKSSVEL